MIPILITLYSVFNTGIVSGMEQIEFLHTKQQIQFELSESIDEVLSVTSDGSSMGMVVDIQNFMDIFHNLETLAGEELVFYSEILDNLTTTSVDDLDLRRMTLENINNLNVQDDNTPRRQRHREEGQRPRIVQRGEALRHSIDGHWQNTSIRQGYRRDNWMQGVHRLSKFDACPDHSSCSLYGAVVLADGTLAVSDAENFEIRVFTLQGNFLRKYDLFPLEPLYMAHFEGYKVFTRMKNLYDKYIIAEIDLWNMTSRTIIEFNETFPWEFACSSPFTVVENSIYVACSPYLFIYDVNGSRLQNYTTATHDSTINVFQSEKGSSRILMNSPAFSDILPRSLKVISVSNISAGPVCAPDNVRWAITGAIGASGVFYAAKEEERYRVLKYSPECQLEGTLLQINRRHQFYNMAVYGDLLIGHVEGRWRRKNNNMLHVYQL